MTDQNDLAIPQQPLTINAAPSFSETLQTAKLLADSGYFPTIRSAAQAYAKILAGQELGIGPMTSVSMIHIVEGKSTMDATLVGAQIKKSGRYDYRLKQSDENICTLTFFERGKYVGESSFTMEDAKRANLTGRATWKMYPKDMLRSRAMTRGARMFCPDIFNGAIYTPEEIGAEVALEDGGSMRVVNHDPEPQTPTRKAEKTAEYERSEYERLVIESFEALGIDPETDNADAVKFVLETIAGALNFPKVPARINGFGPQHLSRFLELNRASLEPKNVTSTEEDVPDNEVAG